MAKQERSAERFLVCRYSFNVDGVDDFVHCTEHRSCIEALALARSWYGMNPNKRNAEVWCGPFNVFDAEHVYHFDMAARHRCAPEAAGLYGYEWENPDDPSSGGYRFVLMKPDVARQLVAEGTGPALGPV